MSKKIKEQHGPALHDSGYLVVPIKAGEKHPGSKGWQNMQAKPADIKKWVNSSYYGGFGVLGKQNPGIDIDVYDGSIVDKIVVWCMSNIGEAPIRIGNAPRVLIPCSAPEGGLGPDNSPAYICEDGHKHQIEIKATGQQWVAYGKHPGTGNFYSWEGGELHDTEADWLPMLTGQKIRDLFEYFESIVPESWTRKSKGRTRVKQGGLNAFGNLEGACAFENYAPPINISVDKLKSMLNVLDPDGRVLDLGWRTVGMALYHQFDGNQEGKDLFIEWSSKSDEFNAEEIELRWPSWEQTTYSGKPVTAATIVAMYNEVMDELRENNPEMAAKSVLLCDWEERFALVELEDGTEVYDAGVPEWQTKRRTLKAFKEHTASYFHEYVTPEGEIKLEPMVDAWRKSFNTKHYFGYIYRPGGERFCTNPLSYGDGAKYINRFYFPPHLESNEGSSPRSTNIAPFIKFVKHLFPEEQERKWFVAWVARMIQFPGERSFVTPVNITPVTGTGRGLLFEILQILVGSHNTHDVSKEDLNGTFNGFLDSCILAVVQEIKAHTGDKKFQIWERMKSLLADTTANIRRMHTDSYTAPVYANFLIFSNNMDALPIEDASERRIYAMRGADKPISVDDIAQIHKWKDDPDNIASLFYWLKELDTAEYNFKRAPISETKRQMVTASIGEESDSVLCWIEEEAPQVFTYDYAMESIGAYLSEDAFETVSLSVRSFGRLLSDRGFHSKQVRVDGGKRTRVWYKPSDVSAETEHLRTLINKKEVLN